MDPVLRAPRPVGHLAVFVVFSCVSLDLTVQLSSEHTPALCVIFFNLRQFYLIFAIHEEDDEAHSVYINIRKLRILYNRAINQD